jgi:DNA-binding NtrC family response regulator
MLRNLADISRTILLVEPDENVRAVTALAMEAFGSIVVSVRTLTAAQAVLGDRPVGAIVSNAVLPDGTGDVLSKGDIPCIFMSADLETAGRLERRGMVCLKMPFPMSRLQNALQAAIGGRSRRAAVEGNAG